jgi:cation:H+ antiporter
MLLSLLLFLVAIGTILGGAAVFTNAVEWLGRRLGISDGAIGSVLAGIATALPETLIPVIAIFWGTSQAETDIGIGAILGAPLMLGTLVLPMLAGFLLLLGRMRKRADQFELDYPAVRHDLGFFFAAYGLALIMSVVPARALHYATAVGLLLMYTWYVRIHVTSGKVSELELDPLYFSRRAGRPAPALIVTQVLGGLGLLIGGAHLFVHVVKDVALGMGVSPLVLALLVAPIATEMPETMNSFFWVYQKKDTLAVGNITGAMVFQGTFPVSVGLVGTGWNLDAGAMLSMALPLVGTALCLAQIRKPGRWDPRIVLLSAMLYAGYMGYLVLR